MTWLKRKKFQFCLYGTLPGIDQGRSSAGQPYVPACSFAEFTGSVVTDPKLRLNSLIIYFDVSDKLNSFLKSA